MLFVFEMRCSPCLTSVAIGFERAAPGSSAGQRCRLQRSLRAVVDMVRLKRIETCCRVTGRRRAKHRDKKLRRRGTTQPRTLDGLPTAARPRTHGPARVCRTARRLVAFHIARLALCARLRLARAPRRHRGYPSSYPVPPKLVSGALVLALISRPFFVYF